MMNDVSARSPSPVNHYQSENPAAATGSEADYLSEVDGMQQSVITNAQRGAMTETVDYQEQEEADRDYIELEDEMEIEEALTKLTRRLESLRGQEK